ncbi:MAG: hypothetical protein BWK78_05165 [Thiotrichaceae bacterium IS1]|nr:MAG: hypothetical protein BWK78_05165 [Thiotrichaceae bacterium IS1]
MLLRFTTHLPFDQPRTERLFCLEKQLRRQSEKSITLKNYSEWLEDAGISMPSRRTLNEDLSRYTDYCDDVRYGEETKSKTLSLDPRATRDAVAYLMGKAWLDSPLRPRLSSSCLRCFLLAIELRAEIDFPYSALRKPGEPWVPRIICGVPVRIIPGIDSGYVRLWLSWGGRMNINLARVSQGVRFTGKNALEYQPLQEEKKVKFMVESSDVYLLERLCKQFPSFVKEGHSQVMLEVDKSLEVMTRDILVAHLHRTQGLEKRAEILPAMEIGAAVLYYEGEIN